MIRLIKKLLEDNAILIAIIVTISIAVLSLTSIPKINFGIQIKESDKYLHFFAYFVLSIVWYFALREKIKTRSFRYFLIVLIIFYGIILEALQGGLTNYRTADVYDAIANTTGIIIASLLFNKLLKWFNTI